MPGKIKTLTAFFLMSLFILTSCQNRNESAKAARTDKGNESNIVLLKLNMGEIEIKLNPEKAPLSVANFKAYVKAGFYDNTIFHRVVNRNMYIIQAGGIGIDGTPKKAILPSIRCESANGLKNSAATIAYGRTNDPNSAAAHFYINFKDNPHLDHNDSNTGYAVFGEIIKGNDIAEKIANLETRPNSPRPKQDAIIESATMVPISK